MERIGVFDVRCSLLAFVLRAMRWPWSRSLSDEDKNERKVLGSWAEGLNKTDWKHYTEPRQVTISVLFTLTTLALVGAYRRFLKRIPSTGHIKPESYRQRSLFGKVTSVGDGDNFRLFHTPGGRLAGWGWLPGRVVPTKRDDLRQKTVRCPIA